MYFTNGPLFLPILMFLFKAFECYYPTDGQPPVLRANPEIVCWDNGYHSVVCFTSLLCLGIYIPTATLLPSTSFRETMREGLDFLFSPVYLQLSYVLKALLMSIRIMFGEHDWIKVPGILAIHIALLLLNVKMQPSCVPAVNLWRTSSFCGSVWVGICGIIHLTFGMPETGDVHRMISVMVALGWALVLVGTLIIQFGFDPLSPLQVAAEAFAAFEYASNADTMPPRALEPLIALSMTQDNDAAEAVFLKADFAEQLVRLLRRSACIPGDTIGDTTGVHYRRARLHRRMTKSVVHAGAEAVGAVRSSSRSVLEVAHVLPPATPDRGRGKEPATPGSTRVIRQISLAPASPSGAPRPGLDTPGAHPVLKPTMSVAQFEFKTQTAGAARVNVRALFSTTWALSNIASRGDRYIAKILEAARKLLHTHGNPPTVVTYVELADDDAEKDDPDQPWDTERAYIVEPFVWVLEQGRGASQIPLQLEVLAALCNLTQDTGFARLVATVRYEWYDKDDKALRSVSVLETLQQGLTSDIERVVSFSALILANCARQSEALRLRLHWKHGVVYAMALMCRSKDVLVQKAAVLGLANFAQSAGLAALMVDTDVKTVTAVCSVAKRGIAALSFECATFFANLGCHADVVSILQQPEQCDFTHFTLLSLLIYLRYIYIYILHPT